MSLGSVLKSIFGTGGFFDRFFSHWVKDADVVAISITEVIKSAMDTGAAGFIAAAVDSVFKTGVAETVLSAIKKYIPDVLAAELAIQGLPANPTEQDITGFENKVLAAFNISDNKSKLYTTLAAQLFTKLKQLGDEGDIKFADAVAAIEEMYQEYLADKADQADGGDVVPQ